MSRKHRGAVCLGCQVIYVKYDDPAERWYPGVANVDIVIVSTFDRALATPKPTLPPAANVQTISDETAEVLFHDQEEAVSLAQLGTDLVGVPSSCAAGAHEGRCFLFFRPSTAHAAAHTAQSSRHVGKDPSADNDNVNNNDN